MRMEEPRTQNQEPGAEGAYSFRNLLLWQKAQDLALAVIKVLASLPRDNAAQIIGRQLLASAGSIGANVAEGHGRFSLAAHKNHLSIAKGSVCETDSWLYLLRRAGYLDAEAEQRLHQDCQEIIRMLTAKILDLERRENRRGRAAFREDFSPYEAADYLPGEEVPGSR